MKKTFLFIALVLASKTVFCQNVELETEKKAITATVSKFFEGMSKKDSSLIRQTLDPSVRLQTTGQKNGVSFLKTESVSDFLKSIAMPSKDILDERILSYDIKIDGQMATAWTPYKFYFNQTFSHCGVNSFLFYKSPDGWKIVQIMDTRRREGCE